MSSEDPDLEGLDPELDVCGSCGRVHRPDVICPGPRIRYHEAAEPWPPSPAERAESRAILTRARAILARADLPPDP